MTEEREAALELSLTFSLPLISSKQLAGNRREIFAGRRAAGDGGGAGGGAGAFSLFLSFSLSLSLICSKQLEGNLRKIQADALRAMAEAQEAALEAAQRDWAAAEARLVRIFF